MEIFYETLNNALRSFFVEQYKVVSDHLLDAVDLRLYPYGNTVKNEADSTYTCPFGDLQCKSNKVHVCYMKDFCKLKHTAYDKLNRLLLGLCDLIPNA